MEESGQRASRKFVVFIHRSVRSRREKREDENKKRVLTHSDQGIAQVRPDKSSATGDENASSSSSWLRFDDGISVLVHCFFKHSKNNFSFEANPHAGEKKICVSELGVGVTLQKARNHQGSVKIRQNEFSF